MYHISALSFPINALNSRDRTYVEANESQENESEYLKKFVLRKVARREAVAVKGEHKRLHAVGGYPQCT